MEGDFHAALFLYRDGVRGDFSYVPLTVSGSYRIMLLDFSSNGSNIVSKASGFQRTAGSVAQILTGLAAFLACSFLPLPAVAAAQGVQLTAPGRQAIDRFLCDLPYAISLPVTLLLSAILLVYALKSRTKRRLFGAIFFFFVVFLLWMVSNSQLLAAMLIDPRPLWRVSAVFLYLVPVAANFVVYEVSSLPTGAGSGSSSPSTPCSSRHRLRQRRSAFRGFLRADRSTTCCCQRSSSAYSSGSCARRGRATPTVGRSCCRS